MVAAFCCCLSGKPGTTASAGRIGVKEIIGVTLIDGGTLGSSPRDYRLSPNGKYCAVVVHRGNLLSGLNEYSLIVFSVESVKAYLGGKDSSRDLGRTLVQFASESRHPAISGLRWIDEGKTLAFIGRNFAKHASPQLFIVKAETGNIKQLTDEPQGILGFDFSAEGNRVLIAIEAEQNETAVQVRMKSGYIVDGQSVIEVLGRGGAGLGRRVTYRLIDADCRASRPTDAVGGAGYLNNPVVDPSGRWAIVQLGVSTLPSHWMDYAMIRERYKYLDMGNGFELLRMDICKEESNEVVLDDIAGRRPIFITQLWLVDLESGGAKPLIDSPATVQLSESDVFWSKDSSSVIIRQALMPIAYNSERESASQEFSVVSVELGSGVVRRVANTNKGRAEWHFARAIWANSDRVYIRSERNDSLEEQLLEEYKLEEDRWVQVSSHLARSEERTQEVEFFSVEGANTPPEIAARIIVSGKQRVVSNFNVWLRDWDCSTVERYEWIDRFGRRHRDGIVYPSGYIKGRRYPVVIQTYGFNERIWEVSKIRAGFAARPLASRGMVVVQTSCEQFSNDEARKFGAEECIRMSHEDLVASLSEAGIVDRRRVGIMGFSRTGLNVQYTITFSAVPFAAALIADSIQATPWCYAQMYGVYLGLREFDDGRYPNAIIGAPMFGAGIAEWMKKSPAFHLANIRTPIRYQHHGTDALPSCWDSFVTMRRMKRPVELLHLLQDEHNLVTPNARFVSQQGSVDWFAFWLLGEERSIAIPDTPESLETLAEQYRRWGKLRDQQAATLAEFVKNGMHPETLPRVRTGEIGDR